MSDVNLYAPVYHSSRGSRIAVSGRNNTLRVHYGPKITRAGCTPLSTLNKIEKFLRHSRNAEYDMIDKITREPCSANTRKVILKTIINWCESEDGPLIYWMSGMAGTGKTAIAYSVCQTLQGSLGASFFCSRFLPDCKNVDDIISTIAFQLAKRFPAFAEALSQILERDRDVQRRALDSQLRALLIAPWTEKKEVLPTRVVIVLDGLDECVGRHTEFIQILFDNIEQLPFKIFITSRPELAIRDAMKDRDTSILSEFILHEDTEVRADIVTYLKDQLPRHTSTEVVNRIADLAGSLFLYATYDGPYRTKFNEI